MTKREILVELVKKEAENLRDRLKVKEKHKLNFEKLNPNYPSYCIYGQATGHCESERANFLIRNCCERVYEVTTNINRFENCKLNGKPKKVPDDKRMDKYFSPIELYIYQNRRSVSRKKYNKILIDYLKGLTDTLNIK